MASHKTVQLRRRVEDSRERLRDLLRGEAILYHTAQQPIADHAGRPMPWIFYSWGITLTHDGASLAADCLIQALRRFDSVQIAGVGMTGLPLASAIVSRGARRYRGLYVRSERETWGTRRQVEGVGDEKRPIVVVDDCICSGASLRRAFAALEEAGYRVEGALCLVNFPWKGGMEWAQALGYRIETLFDAVTDLGMTTEVVNPRSVTAPIDLKTRIAEGLSPTEVARRTAMHLLTVGKVPVAPASLDRAYDGDGGVMVSFRDRITDHRVARGGFYHLPSDQARLGYDVVLATAKTLESSQRVARHGLERLKIAVTLFGKPVPTSFRELDFERFGVLVQSTVQPGKMAEALPNTQFFVSEIEQLRHARFTNARLFSHEPFTMYRHAVTKSVEPGCAWHGFGVSAEQDPDDWSGVGDRLVARARQAILAAFEGREPRNHAEPLGHPGRIDGLAVTLYDHGMIGCWTSFRRDVDAMIREAAVGAWKDPRWRRRAALSPLGIGIVVSVLQRAELLGDVSIEAAAFKVRLGRDSLAVLQHRQSTLLLSYIPCHNGWSKLQMVEGLLRKARISDPPFQWTTYATRSWLGQGARVTVMDAGFPRRVHASGPFPYRATVRLIADYIADKIGPTGLPDYCYYPVRDRSIRARSAARVILALEALLQAGHVLGDEAMRESALAGLRHCCRHITGERGAAKLALADIAGGVTAEVFLINALYRSGERHLIAMPAVQSLVSKLRGFFRDDGAITWEREGRRARADHDLFPGSALRMAACIAAVEGRDGLPSALEKHLAWYRRRFGLLHPWGMVFWQTQGWAALHALNGTSSMAAFVYELADWSLDRQLNKNGAFLVDYAPDGPGFHTACVLEALADASAVAHRTGDARRERTYRAAWVHGCTFVDRLIIREGDRFAMPNPGKSLGGVRESLTSSTVRIDYAAHALLALVKGLSAGLVD